MKTLEASIIIPCKNPGRNFPHVLSSVLAQNAPFDFEVLIIDSGSTDGTIEYIQSIHDPRLRLHHITPESFGHGKTRNLGISLTKGHFAVLITHDACPINNAWLTNLVDTAKKDPQIGGVFGRHIAYPNASPFTRYKLEQHFLSFEKRPIVYLDDIELYQKDLNYRRFLHFFSNNNALLRRTVWEKIPFPDIDFAEDQLWAQKIIEAGFYKAYAKEAIVYHSHNYRYFEQLQRSFDESLAFSNLFRDALCPTMRVFFRSWYNLNKMDYSLILNEKLWQKRKSYFLTTVVNNFMHTLGCYLGTHAKKIPYTLQRKLSRDKSLFAQVVK